MMSILHKVFAFLRLNPDYNNRVFGLDLMRAIAIISVVLVHGLMLEKANTAFPWIRLIDGVELFFVLSGFLIGGILIKIFQKTENFGFKTIGNFWVRRWLRTLPNYYLILAINIIFVYFGIINEDFSKFNWKFFLFLQNFAWPFTGFFWESWSLSIEEWFYLLFPIILILIYKSLNQFNISRKAIFLVAIFLFLLIPLLFRIFIASKFEVDLFWAGVKIFKVVIFRLDGIALGLLAAFIKHWYADIWHKWRNISFLTGLALCYIILYSKWVPNEYITKVYLVLFQSFGCFLMLPKFDSMKKAPQFITKIVTHISLISYSMYLINLALIAEVIMHNFPPQSPQAAWIWYGVYWFAVIFFSTLLYKYYEKPLMDLREKWKSK